MAQHHSHQSHPSKLKIALDGWQILSETNIYRFLKSKANKMFLPLDEKKQQNIKLRLNDLLLNICITQYCKEISQIGYFSLSDALKLQNHERQVTCKLWIYYASYTYSTMLSYRYPVEDLLLSVSTFKFNC